MATVETGDIVLLGLVTMMACYQLATFAMRVGGCRRKYKIEPPELNGPPDFVRIVRAQQNSLEFAPIFFGCFWMSGLFFHQFPAAVIGLVYIYARQQYFNGYIEDAKKRIPGFKLSTTCLKAFLGITMVGIGHNLLYSYLGINLKGLIPFT